MLVAFVYAWVVLYLIHRILQNFHAKDKKRTAKELDEGIFSQVDEGTVKLTDQRTGKQDDEGIPDTSAWTMLKQAALALTLYWNRPTYETSYELQKMLGSAYMAKIGKILPFRNTVWIINASDFKLAKKVMSLSSTWPDRFPTNHYMSKTSFSKPLGLLFGGGDYYKRPHRLLLRLLHQFDFFRPSRMERLVLFEALEVEATFEELIQKGGDGKSVIFSPHTMFERNTLNITTQVVMSHRFPCGDPVAEEMMKLINKANRRFTFPLTILEIIPALRHVSSLTFLGSLCDISNYVYAVLQKIIDEKRDELRQCPNEPRDLVDGFILEMDKSQGKDEYITDQNLVVILRDMIFAGVDTVNSTLEHSILHLALNPEIQRRVQAEIDEVIGHSRAPQYSDKAKMPYTQAVLLEVLRIGSPVPATMRTSADDAVLNGTQLQKGTQFMVNIYGIHRSEQIWDDPLIFRPDRFLNSHNEIVNTDKILPFGLGKRSCLGESVALVSLFIFFITLFRKFSFRISPVHPAPSLKNTHGISRCPIPYYVEMFQRYE